MSSLVPKPGRTILASTIAKVYTQEIQDKICQLKNTSHPNGPLLVGFLANQDPAAEMYARWTGKTAESLG